MLIVATAVLLDRAEKLKLSPSQTWAMASECGSPFALARSSVAWSDVDSMHVGGSGSMTTLALPSSLPAELRTVSRTVFVPEELKLVR